ncbi:unnamed protein product [Paramecium primaurelia]|uniref:Uncharacterized protein n=1 Tax=Paramecium primaurelia TaxID=5886 RepID=A0A8S1PR95_PARPR|nr:unnamed protein product [Paramecium primaurelia]
MILVNYSFLKASPLQIKEVQTNSLEIFILSRRNIQNVGIQNVWVNVKPKERYLFLKVGKKRVEDYKK